MERPLIGEYQSPVEFVKAMLAFRKARESDFTVKAATQKLRRVSPSLVTLIVQGKRKLTVDRADEFAKLLDLSNSEKFLFRNWIDAGRPFEVTEASVNNHDKSVRGRKTVSVSLLNDWINAYVKDLFQLAAVRENPELIFSKLLHVASRKRLQRSLDFLLREGYLRRKLDGSIVLDTPLAVADTRVPSRKIREFHKGALSIARTALDLLPPSERLANTLLIPLDQERYDGLLALIDEFAEKLKDFAEQRPPSEETISTIDSEQLYQLVLNLSPVGRTTK